MSSTNAGSIEFPQELETKIARLANSRKEPAQNIVLEAVCQYIEAAEFRLKRNKKALKSPLLSKEEETAFFDGGEMDS